MKYVFPVFGLTCFEAAEGKSVPQWLKPSSSEAFTAQSKTTSKPLRIIMGESKWFSSPWVSRRLMGTRLKPCPSFRAD